MPAFHDPFAGGGALPLEAQRLGLESYASDLNPVAYFSVDGSPIKPRRKVVDIDTCNTCHDRLALHGGSRREVEYCVMCHNPQNVDWNRRPKLR